MNTREMSDRIIRIVIVDDHPLILMALRNIIEKQTDMEIIAEASDGEEAVKIATELVPDIVIMDISIPKINGIDATRQILVKCPDIAVLALTVHTDSEHVLEILKAGAIGYLTKQVIDESIVHAIRSVFAGETVTSQEVFKQVLFSATRFSTEPLPQQNQLLSISLSVRERDILKLVAMGKGNKEIANILNVSERTIKASLVSIFSKLQVNTRTEAAISGIRLKLISLD